MANVIYNSDWVAAPAGDQYLDLHHNLGKKPIGLSLEGRQDDGQGGYENGLPEIVDGNGDPVEKIRLVDVTDSNTVRVFKPAAYTFTGEIRVQIFE